MDLSTKTPPYIDETARRDERVERSKRPLNAVRGLVIGAAICLVFWVGVALYFFR
ncbi:hypothetical protein [Aureimonas mangrovi]|uniref:hypothetical protein n=1 Tax=Aureimonas mangrovi TaxID=2758041 RepID=UPI00163D755E|nr:hypothetical protein [Aureimonas mangrovi]